MNQWSNFTSRPTDKQKTPEEYSLPSTSRRTRSWCNWWWNLEPVRSRRWNGNSVDLMTEKKTPTMIQRIDPARDCRGLRHEEVRWQEPCNLMMAMRIGVTKMDTVKPDQKNGWDCSHWWRACPQEFNLLFREACTAEEKTSLDLLALYLVRTIWEIVLIIVIDPMSYISGGIWLKPRLG